MKFYGIYRITNLVNGKMYVGQHVTEDLDDGYMGSGQLVKLAVAKYGRESFRKEWLMFCEGKEELDYWESVFADQTWADRADTYNLKPGGAGGSRPGTNAGKEPWNKGRRGVYSESQLAAMRESKRGANNSQFGKARTA